jgi:hypothetical protein
MSVCVSNAVLRGLEMSVAQYRLWQGLSSSHDFCSCVHTSDDALNATCRRDASFRERACAHVCHTCLGQPAGKFSQVNPLKI